MNNKENKMSISNVWGENAIDAAKNSANAAFNCSFAATWKLKDVYGAVNVALAVQDDTTGTYNDTYAGAYLSAIQGKCVISNDARDAISYAERSINYAIEADCEEACYIAEQAIENAIEAIDADREACYIVDIMKKQFVGIIRL